MNFEEIGKLLVKCPKCKFPNPLLRNGLVKFIDNNEENIDISNLTPTKAGLALLEGNTVNYSLEPSFFEDYYDKFTRDHLGISKTTFSPTRSVKLKLEKFMSKYNVTENEILDAVDFYHEKCRLENNLLYSLDAQYFIEKEGGSLLLDNLKEMKKGKFSTKDKLIF